MEAFCRLQLIKRSNNESQCKMAACILIFLFLQFLSTESKFKSYKKSFFTFWGDSFNICVIFYFLDASDILKGNLKLILGLIWTLILKYQISLPMMDDDEDTKSITPKQALMGWVKSKLPPEVCSYFHPFCWTLDFVTWKILSNQSNIGLDIWMANYIVVVLLLQNREYCGKQ